VVVGICAGGVQGDGSAELVLGALEVFPQCLFIIVYCLLFIEEKVVAHTKQIKIK
jgi:hypothetical protein